MGRRREFIVVDDVKEVRAFLGEKNVKEAGEEEVKRVVLQGGWLREC